MRRHSKSPPASALAARPPITLARNLATCTDKGVSAQRTPHRHPHFAARSPTTSPETLQRAPTRACRHNEQRIDIRTLRHGHRQPPPETLQRAPTRACRHSLRSPPRRPWRPLPRSRAPSQTDEKCRYGRRSPRCKRYGRSVSLPPSEFSLDRRSVSRCEKSDRPHATPPTRDVLPVRRNGERPQPHAGRHRHRSPLRRRHRQTPRRKHPPVRPTKDEGAKAPSSKPSVSGRPSRRPAPTAGSQNLSPMPNVGVPQLIPA